VRSPRLRRAAGVAAGFLLVLIGLVGFAHTAAGRPLLRVLALSRGAAAACPLGFDRQARPADREAARARFRESHRGQDRALGRPAWGFVLGQTTREGIVASMRSAGITCRVSRGPSDLTCDGVPGVPSGGAGGGRQVPTRDLWFTFGERRQLISVVALSRDPRPEIISAEFSRVTDELRRGAGRGTPTVGDSAPASLAAGLLRQASAEFRFSDYYAIARVTNMGDGFMLTEEYRSLVD
jgi:hypothetical protein